MGALAPLRAVADEIVVAADARVGEEDLAAYASVADRLLRIEFDVLERHLAWLHAQCRGEWALRLDGDEVPSAELVEALPALTAARDVLQYWTPRRWLWPDRHRWLRELPWYPDMQLRLVRNDGTLRFPGELHTSALPTPPAAYLDVPIYHLACVVEDAPSRRARALRYELAAPGKRAPGGGPANEVFYVPEDHASRAPVPVPPPDAALIARALEPSSPDVAPAPPVRVTPRAEVERLWAGRAGGPSDRRASIEPLDAAPLRFECEERRDLLLRVTNLGGLVWPWGEGQPPEIRLAHRWLDPAGRQVGAEWPRCPLTRTLGPGDTAVVSVGVAAPTAPGTYRLHVDLVHEHVAWFGVDLMLDAEVHERSGAPPAVTPTRAWLRRRRRRPLLIPRTIHRVWLGGGPLPDEARVFEEGWRRHHPGWEMRLWGDAEARDLVPAEVRERARTLAELSDVVRYEVLRRQGGVYIDTDVECMRSFEPLLRGVVAFGGEEEPGRLCNAVIGAVPGHPAMERLCALAPQMIGRAPLPDATGPGLFTAVASADASVTRFTSPAFYPYRWDEPHRRWESFPGAFAVHHWAQSWVG